MNSQLERFRTLTLSMEAAIVSSDWPGLRALLEARKSEIERLRAVGVTTFEDLPELEARVQAVATARLNTAREQVQHLAHVNRTMRAFRAAQRRSRTVDLAR